MNEWISVVVDTRQCRLQTENQSSAYLKLFSVLPAIFTLSFASSISAFLIILSAYRLNKNGDKMQPMLYTWTKVYFIIPNCNASVVLEASADTYLGCYDESGTDEIFITNTGIALSNLTTSNLTTDGCREHCRKNLIYSFAGLWVGIPFCLIS